LHKQFRTEDSEDEYTESSKRKKLQSNRNTFNSSSKKPLILFSAFKPQQLIVDVTAEWSCDSPMIKYHFKRLNAKYHEDGTVTFSESVAIEEIEIAANYLDGERMFSERKSIADYRNAGFIGRGSTKRGIYVSFCMLNYDNQSFERLLVGSLCSRRACCDSG